MSDSRTLSHTSWECKYHVVWIPIYRRKAIYDQSRKYLELAFRDLAAQKESQVMEGHLHPDHVHVLISVPPKYAVSQVVGFIKGESVIHIARKFIGHRNNFTGQHFWARGYYVSTVGRDEATIREYIRKQEREDRRLDQLNMFEE